MDNDMEIQKITKFNRTALIIIYMVLAGYLAHIKAENALPILSAVGGLIAAYIGIKGQGNV